MKVAVCFTAVCLVLATAHPLVKNPYSGPCEIDTSCDDSSYDLQNLKITTSPDPPQENQNVTITVNGTFTKEISGGSVKVVINFNSAPIFDHSYDVCDDVAPAIHKQCPLHAGPVSASLSIPIPDQIPNGKYSIDISGTDQDGGKLLCSHITCEI